MQRLIDANAVKENHERWIGYLDDDMIGRMNFAIDHHISTVLEIPDNPTNGDVIKAMFPNAECWEDKMDYVMNVDFGNDIIQRLDLGWWNTPYEGGVK